MLGFAALAAVDEGGRAAHSVLVMSLYALGAIALAVGALGLAVLIGLFFLARFIRHLWRNRRHPLRAFHRTPALREVFTLPQRIPGYNPRAAN